MFGWRKKDIGNLRLDNGKRFNRADHLFGSKSASNSSKLFSRMCIKACFLLLTAGTPFVLVEF